MTSRATIAACWLLLAAAIVHGDEFPAPFNHGVGAESRPLDPQAAADGFRLPEGFKAQVFAAEPGLYAPELKAGMRIENDYLVTETGVELLSNFPLEL